MHVKLPSFLAGTMFKCNTCVLNTSLNLLMTAVAQLCQVTVLVPIRSRMVLRNFLSCLEKRS